MTATNIDLDRLRDAIKAPGGASVVEYTSAHMGVEWRRIGTRHVALCVYHDESTPSWTVEDSSPERSYCHGCGKHADVIAVAQDHLDVSYPEALLVLADFAGIPADGLDNYTPPPRPARPKKSQAKKPKKDVKWLRVLRRRSWDIRDAEGTLVAVHGREDWEVKETQEGAEPERKRRKKMWWSRSGGRKGLGGMPDSDLPLYGAELVKDYPLGHNVYLTKVSPTATRCGRLATTRSPR